MVPKPFPAIPSCGGLEVRIESENAFYIRLRRVKASQLAIGGGNLRLCPHIVGHIELVGHIQSGFVLFLSIVIVILRESIPRGMVRIQHLCSLDQLKTNIPFARICQVRTSKGKGLCVRMFTSDDLSGVRFELVELSPKKVDGRQFLPNRKVI